MDFMQFRTFLSGHKLGSILVVGVIARVLLMPFSAHPFDVYVWYDTSLNIVRNGPLSVQVFPPLWGHYMMVPIAYTYDWLARVFSVGAIPMASLPSALDFYPSYNVKYVPGVLFNSVVKFPFLVSDVLVMLLLHKIVGEMTESKVLAEKAAFLWFLNPFLIWISGGWGMWDTLPVLFSLACFFLLLKKKVVLSSVCLSLAVASKLYPALFLLPITIYLLKTSPAGERLKNGVKFCSVFLAASLVLFLPYIGRAMGFFIGFFVPNPSGIATTVANPVVEPIGFGLTCWSLYLLNRLVNIPVSAEFVFLSFVVSGMLVVFSLTLTYWRISKLTFQKPFFDMVTAMLLCVLALFLSYRIICEQWFVWALPFLSIMCVGGSVKGTLYWGASFIALLYSVLNCPLPFFLLPLSPWIAHTLLGMVYFSWTFESIRIVLLAILGCLFSALMIIVIFRQVAWPSPNRLTGVTHTQEDV